MAEYSVPALVEPVAGGNLSDYVVDNAVQAPHATVFNRRVGDRWEDVTAREFHQQVVAVAKGLIAEGVLPGDRIGLMSKTRYEWTLCDFAIWFAGAVTVPIYETSSAEQVQWILADSAAVGIFAETNAHEAAVAEVRDEVPALRHVWGLDSGGLDSVTAAGRDVPDGDVDARRADLVQADVATIIYTSGTTGRPKGCELTHGNLLAETENVTGSMPQVFARENSSILLFLPLAHVLARVLQMCAVRSRMRVRHTAEVKNLVADLGEFKPSLILSVPRVFEKIYNASAQKAEAGGKGKIFTAATATAIAYSQAIDHGGPGIGLRVRHAVFDRLVYGKLRAALGGNVEFAASGGAPLGERLGHFFRGVGVTVLEGYGLTETTAAATISTPDAIKVGAVGRPVPGTSVRIAEDGEVLIKGPVVFRGYLGNANATAEALSGDGWFHSGDLGELDADGYLRITGRKKEIIVTAGGKNVAPAVLEDRLRAHPLVSQCVVVGDAQPFVACLVTLDGEALPGWLQARDLPAVPAKDLIEDPTVVAEIQGAVDEANKAVSQAEAIKKFTILPVDFSEEGGQLTPTMKLKRAVVMKQFSGEVDALYS